MGGIAERYKQIREQLPSEVELVVVSKFHPIEDLLEAYNAGVRDFGENHVQELLPKFEVLPKDIRWHFVGNLQRNKVKQIIPFVHLIHSVDSLSLYQEISKRAKSVGRIVDVLIEVHIAEELSKEGYSKDDLLPFLHDLSRINPSQSYVRVCGLMGMATFTDDKDQVRHEFTLLRELFQEAQHKYFSNMPYFKTLSMGMSSDWDIALSCGSTLLRVGTSIMGSRSYNSK